MLTTSRRDFIRLGTAGTAALGLSTGVASLSGCTRQPMRVAGFQVLSQNDLDFLSALAPAILSESAYPGPLGEGARERLLRGLDQVMVTLQHYSRRQMQLAFTLMGYPVTRLFADAPLKSWAEATDVDAEQFLSGWKDSALPIKRMGYAGLCKLFAMVWYAQPENFALSGYPGPPKKIPYPVNRTRPAHTD